MLNKTNDVWKSHPICDAFKQPWFVWMLFYEWKIKDCPLFPLQSILDAILSYFHMQKSPKRSKVFQQGHTSQCYLAWYKETVKKWSCFPALILLCCISARSEFIILLHLFPSLTLYSLQIPLSGHCFFLCLTQWFGWRFHALLQRKK